MTTLQRSTLQDIASFRIWTVATGTPLSEVVRLFAQKGVSCMVVTRAQEPVGIVTERDLLRLLCEGHDTHASVESVMSTPLTTARPDLDLSIAQAVLSHRGIRHLVLVDAQGLLLGVASETDIRRHISADLFQVIEHLTAVIQTSALLPPDTPLTQALSTMMAGTQDHVLIGVNGQAQGIITERDVPRLMSQHPAPGALTVAQVMSHPLHTIPLSTSVAEAARRMDSVHTRHLVVNDAQGRVIGVVGQHQLLERLSTVLEEEKRHWLLGQMSLILETTGIGTWEFDHATRLLKRNSTLLNLLHLTSSHAIEPFEGVLSRIDPSYQTMVRNAVSAHPTDWVDTFDVEYPAQDGRGQRRWFNSRGRIVERTSQGMPLRTIGVTIDIDAQKTTELAAQHNKKRFQTLLEQVPVPLCHVGRNDQLLFMNRHFTQLFGYVCEDIPDLTQWWLQAYPDPVYRQWVQTTWAEALSQASAHHEVIRPVVYRVRCKTGQTRLVEISGIMLGDEDFLATFIDMTPTLEQAQRLTFSNHILQLISDGLVLHDILNVMCQTIEAVDTGMRCSILLLDADGQHLRHGAAPSLPPAYIAAIDGVCIGPQVGSCGTAAHRKTAVLVNCIAHDPLWANYKTLALQHGLEACWSSPILSSTGAVLGTFAIYWATPHPLIPDVVVHHVETATTLGRIAIENAQRKHRMHAQLDELRRWQHITLGREDRVLALKREVNALLAQQGEAPRYPSVAPEQGHKA